MMKAVYLLLCIVLPRDIAGSIFKSPVSPYDILSMEPLGYMGEGREHRQDVRHRNREIHNEMPQSSQGHHQSSQKHQYSLQEEIRTYLEKNNPTWNKEQKSESNSKESKQLSRESSEESKEGQRQNPGDNKIWTPFDFFSGWSSRPMQGTPFNILQSVNDFKNNIDQIYKNSYESLTQVTEEDRRRIHDAVEKAVEVENEDYHLNATQLAQKNNYKVEEHIVKTDDGYLLTLMRIPARKVLRDMKKRPVVLLMHDLLGSADDWLLTGPGKSLAYLLSDVGCDVWLGNARGSKYSRRHVSKHPAQRDFWQFSVDEIALQDLPSMIDYALKVSGQEKLYYIGHSQGTTAFFALTSTHPEYNDKIVMMYALSPMVYMSKVRSPLLRMIAPDNVMYQQMEKQLGDGEFRPSKELISLAGGSQCETAIGCKHICSNINFVMSGINVQNWDVNLLPTVIQHLPAGASTRQMKQYGQAVVSREFRRYDFGNDVNEKVYGTPQPPNYELKNVTTPVSLYYSEGDWFAHPDDVERLSNELPVVKEVHKIPQNNFSHMDFQFSKNAPELIYQRVIASIKENYY